MNLSVIRRILREDLNKAGTLPSWIDALLSPLNEFIDKVTTALRQNLTLQENIAGKFFQATFTDGVALKIASGTTTLKVVGVWPLAFGTQTMTSFAWSRQVDGNISVKFGFASVGASDACTIFLIYGV